MTDLGTAIINPVPGSFLSYVVSQAVATLWGRNGWQNIIRTNSSVSMEAFLDDFFTNLFSWTGTTRESYAVNPYCLEPAVQQLLAIVFDSTTEQVIAFKKSLFNKWDFVVNPYADALNLLPRIQNQIKSLATIDNPEF